MENVQNEPLGKDEWVHYAHWQQDGLIVQGVQTGNATKVPCRMCGVTVKKNQVYIELWSMKYGGSYLCLHAECAEKFEQMIHKTLDQCAKGVVIDGNL